MTLRFFSFFLISGLISANSLVAQSPNLLNQTPASVSLYRSSVPKQLNEMIFYNSDGSMFNRYTYDYTENGCLNSDTYYIWDKTTNGWREHTRYNYFYDSNNKMIERIFQYQRNNYWTNSSHDIYHYNSNGTKSISSYASWNPETEAWSEIVGNSTYLYNEAGKLAEHKTQLNNSINRILYTYDSNSRMIEELLQSWNADTQNWTDEYKTTFSYDTDKLQMNYLYFKWNNDQWQVDHKVVTMYDGDGDVVRSDYYHLPDTSKMKVYCIYTYGEPQKQQTTHSADRSEFEYFHISPNPATTFILVNINPNLIGASIYLFDETGKLVKKAVLNSESNQINVSDLSRGIYFARINDKTKKIILN